MPEILGMEVAEIVRLLGGAAESNTLMRRDRDYHSDPSAYIRDRRRDRAATAGQRRVLRFAGAEVIADARAVALEVRSVLEALQS